MYVIKKDDYYKARGGPAKILKISCRKCKAHIAFYQKDGPGNLRRMYLDRIIDSSFKDAQLSELKCTKCDEILGLLITYEKEDRRAYRLYVDAIEKAVTSVNKM